MSFFLKSLAAGVFTIASFSVGATVAPVSDTTPQMAYEDISRSLTELQPITFQSGVEKYKILVFSQFTSVLKKLRKELIERGIESKYLDGTTVAKERISLVNEFNESKEAQVFLISLKAGGTGLNLTSAKFVMHMDPWWNPAIEDQATDRAHRIGQKNIVEVIKLIAKDTIEENIIKLQEDKREIINSVISDDSLNINNISKLTNEEILDLFK